MSELTAFCIPVDDMNKRFKINRPIRFPDGGSGMIRSITSVALVRGVVYVGGKCQMFRREKANEIEQIVDHYVKEVSEGRLHVSRVPNTHKDQVIARMRARS